jgi:hypothetical protein
LSSFSGIELWHRRLRVLPASAAARDYLADYPKSWVWNRFLETQFGASTCPSRGAHLHYRVVIDNSLPLAVDYGTVVEFDDELEPDVMQRRERDWEQFAKLLEERSKPDG